MDDDPFDIDTPDTSPIAGWVWFIVFVVIAALVIWFVTKRMKEGRKRRHKHRHRHRRSRRHHDY